MYCMERVGIRHDLKSEVLQFLQVFYAMFCFLHKVNEELTFVRARLLIQLRSTLDGIPSRGLSAILVE